MKNADCIEGTPGVFKLYDMQKPELQEQVKKRENGEIKNSQNEKQEKHTWGNSTEFLMSCIAYSVGFGNVWRFPHTAYTNGGGVFVIVYLIVLFIAGKPLYYLESVIGQFSSRSSIKMWELCPAFEGIGPGVTITVFLVQSYYTSLMALVLYYLILSFQSPLPWSSCLPEWGSDCFNSSASDYSNSNSSDMANMYSNATKSSSELFFYKVVLQESGIQNGLGTPSWQLVLYLFISWIFVFIVLFNGVKSSGKASYFLAIFPYVMMITLFVKTLTLEGAINGIIYFLQPDWSKIGEPTVWYAAVTQAFFSLGVCFGGVVMYASYNKFEHNVTRDCMIVSTLDLCTSLIAGSTIFGILGNLAHEIGTDDFQSIVRSGTGLAFISYPEAIAKFPFLQSLFSVFFFLMLFVLGLGSSVAFCNVVITNIREYFPKFVEWKVTFFVCLAGFFVGIVYCTPGGQYMLNLVDYYAGTVIVIILATLEIIAISWIYGVDNFLDDMEFMVKIRPTLFWRACWGLLTPATLCIIFLYFMSSLKPLTYNNEYYPTSAYVAGWIMVAIGILPFFVVLAVRAHKNKQNVMKIFQPSDNWGPNNNEHHKQWKIFKEAKQQRRRIAMNRSAKSKLCAILFDKN